LILGPGVDDEFRLHDDGITCGDQKEDGTDIEIAWKVARPRFAILLADGSASSGKLLEVRC
jgi:hypothetical protein